MLTARFREYATTYQRLIVPWNIMVIEYNKNGKLNEYLYNSWLFIYESDRMMKLH